MVKKKISAQEQRDILAKNLNALLKSRGKTQADLVRELNLPEATLRSWFNGEKYPRIQNLQLLADYFNVRRSDLTEEKIPGAQKVVEFVKIPILGKIACGNPITALENVNSYKKRSADDLPPGELFYLEASGNSMSPIINDGSLVLCRRQEDVENGEIAAVLVNSDEETTLKKVRKVNDMVILEPINDDYEPYIITEKNPARIVGKALEVVSKL